MRQATIRVLLKLIEETQENRIYLQKHLAAAGRQVTKHRTHCYHISIGYVFQVSQQLKHHYFIFNTLESLRLFIIPKSLKT